MMLSIMINVAAVSALAESLVWVAAPAKKMVDEIFYGIISVHIMHSQPVVISAKVRRISEIKFDQKDLVKRLR